MDETEVIAEFGEVSALAGSQVVLLGSGPRRPIWDLVE
jgi:hypothetical protein